MKTELIARVAAVALLSVAAAVYFYLTLPKYTVRERSQYTIFLHTNENGFELMDQIRASDLEYDWWDIRYDPDFEDGPRSPMQSKISMISMSVGFVIVIVLLTYGFEFLISRLIASVRHKIWFRD